MYLNLFKYVYIYFTYILYAIYMLFMYIYTYICTYICIYTNKSSSFVMKTLKGILVSR